MPSFDTPGPLAVTVDLDSGELRLAASERSDTVVVVTPCDPSVDADVRAAERARVVCSNGKLLVGTAPTGKGEPIGSLHVLIELPAGSTLRGRATAAGLHATGRLDGCRFITVAGDIRLEHTGPLVLSTSSGDITAGQVEGAAEISTGRGEIRIARIAGSAEITNSYGPTALGEVTGALRFSSADGRVSVGRAGGAVHVTTSGGDVRIDEVVRDTVLLKTASGALDIGIRESTAARFDLDSRSGNVFVAPEVATAPTAPEDRVRVRARAGNGSVHVRRSRLTATAAH
ncbi:DUF4097 family beta strand repeat-containing protein [Streptomyces sp. NPDC000594]|uniref:DUF4097 family beta strand repeat-containing protein n=1 Tax=Streptomyces sp. NPDC000594 TaxID=3154261 RepID=UPI00332C6A71